MDREKTMPQSKITKLPTTSYVMLGLLTFREMSGYDLKLLADRSIKYFYWSPTKSQIYSELRRLETHGLVTMREVVQQQRPDKRIYTITAAGRAAMEQWLGQTDIKPDTYKSQLLLKLFFGHLASPQTLITLLEQRQQELEKFLEWCKEKKHDLEEQLEEPVDEASLIFPLYTLQNTLAKAHADLSWAETTLKALKQRRSKTS
jgi:DNA-binding PadR family transcriptional regulator